MRAGDWVTYNGPLSGDRYSPLAQITAANVGQLTQVCAFDAPEAVNFQSGIVAVNGVLYNKRVPEPSTYGAIFIGLSVAFFGWRRHRRGLSERAA